MRSRADFDRERDLEREREEREAAEGDLLESDLGSRSMTWMTCPKEVSVNEQDAYTALWTDFIVVRLVRSVSTLISRCIIVLIIVFHPGSFGLFSPAKKNLIKPA